MVKPSAGKQILQVQTDFNATLPIHIHKPAGSITIKADHPRKKPSSIERVEGEGSLENTEATGNSSGKLNVSSFNGSKQNARGARNS